MERSHLLEEPKLSASGVNSDSDNSELSADINLEAAVPLLEGFSTEVDHSTSNCCESQPDMCLYGAAGDDDNMAGSNICRTVSDMYDTSLCEYDSGHLDISHATGADLTPLPERKIKSPDSETSTDLLNTCRICQLPGDEGDILFSPCRCSGSLKFVHSSCLLKWIEVSSKKNRRPPQCELCQFLYVRHKHFKFHDWHLPRVSRRDKFLHAICGLMLVVMVICAVTTIFCFLAETGQITQVKTYLSMQEVITLTCGVLFFVSFFLAMSVEIKARHTVYSLFHRFVVQNTEWKIQPYDRDGH